MCIFTGFQGMLMLLAWGMHLESPLEGKGSKPLFQLAALHLRRPLKYLL